MKPTPLRSVLRKDRLPFPGTNINDGRKKLAVLVDGKNVASDVYPLIEDSIESCGIICLRRVFDYSMAVGWKALQRTYGFEWFRVDNFVPLHMQIFADVQHILHYRNCNLIDGVALVVSKSQCDSFTQYLERLSWNSGDFSVYTEGGLHFKASLDGK